MDDFVANLSKGGPRGLWVFGPRRSGTSTVAREVVERVYASESFNPLLAGGCLISAQALSDLQRRVWTQEELMRSNGNDLALWQETQALLSRWDDVWDANILMIDDMIQVDVEFWKRHLLGRLDQRLKGPGVTLVCGVVQPKMFGPDWSTGFKSLCTVMKMGDVSGEG